MLVRMVFPCFVVDQVPIPERFVGKPGPEAVDYALFDGVRLDRRARGRAARRRLPARPRARRRRSSSRSRSRSRCCSRARRASARRRPRSRSRRALGARLIRLQCYEGLDVAHAVYEWNYPRQLLHIRAAQEGTVSRGRALRAGVPDPPAAARGDRHRRAGRAPDRRDRPRRRGVRGVPARGALRLPDHDPRDRHDHARGARRR